MTATSQGKLSQHLLRSLSHADSGQQLSIIVRYAADRRVMRHQQHVHGVSPGYSFRLRPLAQMKATPSAIADMESDPQVLRISADMPVRAFMNTAVPQTQVPRVWADGYQGDGVRIAIVDTGVDLHHPDLAGRIAGTADFTGEGLLDYHGHGTHCAGIAAGSGDASGGSYRGVAPKAEIYAAKVLGSDGQGMMSDVMAGVEWAVSQNVQIISLSLGGIGPSNGQDALSDICNAAVEAGVVVVTAAGNDGPYSYTIGSPGAAERVITVGAVNDGDRLASFSSRGPTADGRTKPDLVLPGVDVIAPRAQGTSLGSIVDDYYVAASGTSMAAPHGAGICALLLQAHPEWTPDDIKRVLMATAIDIGQQPDAQGFGRADAWLAHTEQSSTPTPIPPTPDPPEGAQGCLLALFDLFFAASRAAIRRTRR